SESAAHCPWEQLCHGQLLLLLLTTHPGSLRAQHWPHGWHPGGKRASSLPQNPQRAPRLPGRSRAAAGRPGQGTHSLPSNALPTPENCVPWKSRTVAQWHLRGKQHLVQTLLVSRVRGHFSVGTCAPCRPPAPLLLPPARGRKTRHDPPAKSKVGRVAKAPDVDPAELFVVTERYRLYRQTVRALRAEFSSEVRRKMHEARVGVLAERKAREDATEHSELMAWNQTENRRLHELRISRLQREAQEQEQRLAEEQARRAREAQAWAQLKEQEVLQLQVRSEEAKNFITRENLEAKVQEALDSPKSYDWAVTREGQVVRPQHKGS
ncbi:28S ribosomal protein S26, mitochondrial, partial [Galemys pyrenaicus]